MKDYRVEEFTARIEEAEHYYELAVSQKNTEIIKTLKNVVGHLKQQRTDIIRGVV